MKKCLLMLCCVICLCLSMTQIQISSADLVGDTCKQTPNKDLCEKTLRRNPGSATADVAGLGIIMVDAVQAQGTATVGRINSLLGSTTDPKGKDALRGCLSKYNAILKGDVPSAREALQKNNPKIAQQGMNDATNEARSCEGSFSEASSPISSFNMSLTDLSTVASAIISLLL